MIAVVLKHFLDEVVQDVKAGQGEGSLSVLSRLNQLNTGARQIVCSKCHFCQTYDVNSYNTCSQCHYNPSVYDESENTNPYTRFGMKSGEFNKVKSYELDPLDLNPSSYKSLCSLLDQIGEMQNSKGDKVANLGVDGLPGVRIKRLQTEFVICVKHNVKFKLSDPKECEKHCDQECEIGWLYGDKVILLGNPSFTKTQIVCVCVCA